MADDDTPDGFGEDEFQELLRSLLGGGAGFDPAQLGGLERLGVDPAMLRQLMGQMQAAFTSGAAGSASEGIDWSAAKVTGMPVSRLSSPIHSNSFHSRFRSDAISNTP